MAVKKGSKKSSLKPKTWGGKPHPIHSDPRPRIKM